MTRLRLFFALCVVLLAVAPTASAHLLVVTPSGGGTGTSHWVGGLGVPGDGAGLIPSPIGMLPAAHGAGLVHACLMTMDNGTVLFIAPPFFPMPDFDCMHGH
jgi:hypothetical protein